MRCYINGTATCVISPSSFTQRAALDKFANRKAVTHEARTKKFKVNSQSNQWPVNCEVSRTQSSLDSLREWGDGCSVGTHSAHHPLSITSSAHIYIPC